MRKLKYAFLLFFIICATLHTNAQGTLPIYSDYLSDNIFIVHPSAAGIGNSAKLRMTQREQWNGVGNSPSLQTLSFHGTLSQNTAIGALVFNDKNGFHSQIGIQGAYAYHLNFRNAEALNQLSFGLATSYVQNTLDQTKFVDFDPVVSQVIESDAYFNADLSFAYHNLDGFAYVTIKNIVLNARQDINPEFKSLNLRRYLLNVGYFFGRGKNLQFEPSAMFQYIEATNEKLLDVNAKVYQTFGRTARVWLALSYRRSLDRNDLQELSLLTPIAGIEFNRFLIAYTYTHQLGGLIVRDGGFHQITLGINLFNRRRSNRGYNSRYNSFLYKTNN
ncbi:type IX secretion system membrane protein PorP/SprF [Maribacter sp. CXY002]|uniref:PorP/SprF family type IX secretion system membrane protein n=1 Tax=Maribacter luteocoastalis TaxID=3407671 RepID=UPI003B66EA1F